MVQKDESTLDDPFEPFFFADIPAVNLGLRDFIRAVILSSDKGEEEQKHGRERVFTSDY